MIKAIETYYNGYKFRSRLEARWAIFFNTFELHYKYENEGYKINNRYYLPDFMFDDFFIEIKPDIMADDSYDKGHLLCHETKKDVYIIQGQPWPNEYRIDFFSCDEMCSSDGDQINIPYIQQDYIFAQDRRCNCLWVYKCDIEEGICNAFKLSKCKDCTDHDRYPIIEGELIDKAYKNARQARFEFSDNQAFNLTKTQGHFL